MPKVHSGQISTQYLGTSQGLLETHRLMLWYYSMENIGIQEDFIIAFITYSFYNQSFHSLLVNTSLIFRNLLDFRYHTN